MEAGVRNQGRTGRQVRAGVWKDRYVIRGGQSGKEGRCVEAGVWRQVCEGRCT